VAWLAEALREGGRAPQRGPAVGPGTTSEARYRQARPRRDSPAGLEVVFLASPSLTTAASRMTGGCRSFPDPLTKLTWITRRS